MYASSAEDSADVGLSGNFAIVVWRSFQAARPSSALMVSLPILEEMTAPFRREESMAWEGAEGFEEADDGGVRVGDEGWWKMREVKKRKAATAEKSRKKRLLAMWAFKEGNSGSDS